MAVKKLTKTDLVPNPLHQYASYTYSWSLWWLDIVDFNRLMSSDGVEDALKWNPSPNSFVVAEDAGLYPDRRQPGTLGLNYHIQNVKFDTAITPNTTSKSSNMTNGSMTIIEPYGVTLIDALVAAAFDGTTFTNYMDQPYMLELKFHGYDDMGNKITDKETAVYNKRFPIRLLEMKLEVTNRGAEYRLSFAPFGGMVHQDRSLSKIPKQLNITAGTIDEFFNGPEGLSAQLQDHFKSLIGKNNATFADAVVFKIDPTIAESKIVNESKVAISKANPKTDKIDLKQGTFSIPEGTAILDVITKIMAHSDFLLKLQLGLETDAAENIDTIKQTNVLNAFKTLAKIEYAGLDANGQKQAATLDIRSNRYPKIATYSIMQYAVWSSVHPAGPLLADGTEFIQKLYNYIYTGQNTDIIDLKINFDSTYYTAILAFTATKSSENASKDTKTELSENSNPNPVSLNPAIFARIYPEFGQRPNVTPPQYKFLVDDKNITGGMNIKDRPAAQVTADVVNSIYTSASQEMLEVVLTIVGDPTLLKQDDWLYIPDPTKGGAHNDWDISSSSYSKEYGHLPFDRQQPLVRVVINSPVDMDIDQTNEGLAYPNPRYATSLFSGEYIITRIENRFANGKFEQVLHMSRRIYDAYTGNGNGQPITDNQRTDTPTPSMNNDINLVPTNPTAPAGDTATNITTGGDAEAQDGGFYGNSRE